MSRTQPRLEDLHPWLRWRVNELAVDHRTANPGTALCLIWGHRSPTEQMKAFKAGRSKLDGVKRFSLHNYMPSLAADVWVYTNAGDESLYENRPPRDEGLDLQLLQRGSLRQWYMPLGNLAVDLDLEAGALWRRFRDGPHVQIPKAQRMKLVQEALNQRGFSAGIVDGDIGPKTRAAIESAKGESTIHGYFKSSLMPVHPDLWAWLHREEVA